MQQNLYCIVININFVTIKSVFRSITLNNCINALKTSPNSALKFDTNLDVPNVVVPQETT